MLSKLWVFKGKIGGDKMRTYTSWDGPPSDAYKIFVPLDAVQNLIMDTSAQYGEPETLKYIEDILGKLQG